MGDRCRITYPFQCGGGIIKSRRKRVFRCTSISYANNCYLKFDAERAHNEIVDIDASEPETWTGLKRSHINQVGKGRAQMYRLRIAKLERGGRYSCPKVLVLGYIVLMERFHWVLVILDL